MAGGRAPPEAWTQTRPPPTWTVAVAGYDRANWLTGEVNRGTRKLPAPRQGFREIVVELSGLARGRAPHACSRTAQPPSKGNKGLQFHLFVITAFRSPSALGSRANFSPAPEKSQCQIPGLISWSLPAQPHSERACDNWRVGSVPRKESRIPSPQRIHRPGSDSRQSATMAPEVPRAHRRRVAPAHPHPRARSRQIDNCGCISDPVSAITSGGKQGRQPKCPPVFAGRASRRLRFNPDSYANPFTSEHTRNGRQHDGDAAPAVS